MAHIRGERVDLFLVSVQGEREKLSLFDPEIPVEPLLQISSLALEPFFEGRVAPYSPCEPGATHFGVIDVALDFARRPRKFRQTPVRMAYGVPRIFPTLVLKAAILVVSFILHIAVAIAIAVSVDPIQGHPRGELQFPDELCVSRPLLVLG